jgi:virginiamycin A acetyltransferase
MILLSYIKRLFRWIIAIVIVPVALLLSALTQFVYVSELLSMIPFRTGNLVRYWFYRLMLKKCGKGVTINFGTIITYKDTTIGNNVWLGVNNIFGRVDIQDDVITAQACQFVSGKRGHGIDRTDVPIMSQPGEHTRLQIGPDVWFGANCTVAANVGKGCVIGSGAVVVQDIPDWSVAVGNPSRVIRSRR